MDARYRAALPLGARLCRTKYDAGVARRIGTSRDGLAGRDAGQFDERIPGLFAQSEAELKPFDATPAVSRVKSTAGRKQSTANRKQSTASRAKSEADGAGSEANGATSTPSGAPTGAASHDGSNPSRAGALRKSQSRSTHGAAKPAPRGRLAVLATPPQPASAPVDPRLAWIDRTRVYRAIRERDTTIDRVVHGLEREFTDRQRALGDVIDAWNSLVPPALRPHVSVAGVAAGTLTLSVASSGASYELSRALRDGLERRMVELLPGRVRRIKVRVGGE
jgi:hypothetical protein